MKWWKVFGMNKLEGQDLREANGRPLIGYMDGFYLDAILTT